MINYRETNIGQLLNAGRTMLDAKRRRDKLIGSSLGNILGDINKAGRSLSSDMDRKISKTKQLNTQKAIASLNSANNLNQLGQVASNASNTDLINLGVLNNAINNDQNRLISQDLKLQDANNRVIANNNRNIMDIAQIQKFNANQKGQAERFNSNIDYQNQLAKRNNTIPTILNGEVVNLTKNQLNSINKQKELQQILQAGIEVANDNNLPGNLSKNYIYELGKKALKDRNKIQKLQDENLKLEYLSKARTIDNATKLFKDIPDKEEKNLLIQEYLKGVPLDTLGKAYKKSRGMFSNSLADVLKIK